MEGQWCTIESDPNVFRELATKLGIINVQFEEIVDFDFARETLSQHERLYGFVFLFKWTGNQQPFEGTKDDTLLFIKQNVTNSCATIALLHLAFNTDDIKLSEKLQRFKEFIAELPADLRGMALTNSEAIRTAHNSFISFGSINADQNDKEEGGDAFHFVALLPQDGKLTILDGMAEEPYVAAQADQNCSQVEMVINYVKKKIDDSNGEIRFSLLAMVPDKLVKLRGELENCTDPLLKANLQVMIDEEERKRKQTPTNSNDDDELSSKEKALLIQALALASQLRKPSK